MQFAHVLGRLERVQVGIASAILRLKKGVKIQDLEDSQKENVCKKVGYGEGREIYKQKTRNQFKVHNICILEPTDCGGVKKVDPGEQSRSLCLNCFALAS